MPWCYTILYTTLNQNISYHHSMMQYVATVYQIIPYYLKLFCSCTVHYMFNHFKWIIYLLKLDIYEKYASTCTCIYIVDKGKRMQALTYHSGIAPKAFKSALRYLPILIVVRTSTSCLLWLWLSHLHTKHHKLLLINAISCGFIASYKLSWWWYFKLYWLVVDVHCIFSFFLASSPALCHRHHVLTGKDTLGTM